MFQTNQIAQPLHSQPGQKKIPEFPGAVQCSGVVNHVVMNVFPVCVRCNNKGVLAFREPHGQFIAYLVGFLGGDLSGFE